MTNPNSKSKWTIERFSFILIGIGILIAIATFFLFVMGEEFNNSSSQIKADKFAHYGDTIGGVVGSLWALAGVLLFYAAFKKQIEALEDQKESTRTTQRAVELQSKELRLQREELSQTREVFKEQEKTLKVQQYESTYFNLLNLLNALINSMDILTIEKKETKSATSQYEERMGRPVEAAEYENISILHSGRDFFSYILYKLEEELDSSYSQDIIRRICKEHFDENVPHLEPYFKLLKQLLIRIDKCPFENQQEYLDILASQISSKERELIIYFEKAERLDEELLRLLKKYKIIEETE